MCVNRNHTPRISFLNQCGGRQRTSREIETHPITGKRAGPLTKRRRILLTNAGCDNGYKRLRAEKVEMFPPYEKAGSRGDLLSTKIKSPFSKRGGRGGGPFSGESYYLVGQTLCRRMRQSLLRRAKRRALAFALWCSGASNLRLERHGLIAPGQMPKARRSQAAFTSMAAAIFSSTIRFISVAERRFGLCQFTKRLELRSKMVVTAEAQSSTAIMPKCQASPEGIFCTGYVENISKVGFIY
jgi:hypothetical protein